MTRTSVRPGKTRLGLQAKLSLSGITHSDGSALRDGDSVVLQAVADDFDDVTLDKQPGRSEEVEVHIVSPSTMAAILNEFQVRLRNEFLDLRKLQQDAIRNVQSVDQLPQNGGSAQERAVDTLVQRLGLATADPLAHRRPQGRRFGRKSAVFSARPWRIRPTHAASDRLLRQIVGELERVGGAALEKAETAIARAFQERQGQETSSSQKPNAALSQAVTHQREIERMIDDSLRALEPWAKVHEVQAEARQLAGDQQHLFDETQSLEKRIPRGESWEGLDPEQQGNLNQAADRQTSLADRAAELLGKLDRLAQLGKAKDASLSAKLAEGAAEGRRSGVAGLMNQSAQRIRENHLQQSRLLQREATQQLEQIAQKLSEGGSERPDRLRKKLRDLSARVEQLIAQQDKLEKKLAEAQGLTDSKQQGLELKKLGREQEALRRQAEDLIEQMAKFDNENGIEALRNAAEKMEQAVRRLLREESAKDESRQLK